MSLRPIRGLPRTSPCGRIFTETNGSDKAMSNSSAGASSGSRVVPVQLLRKTSIEDFNEQMVGMLDEVERRVEQLRESAGHLEQEKESLLDMLGNVNLNAEILRLGQGNNSPSSMFNWWRIDAEDMTKNKICDRDDINATTNRLLNRCRAVEVVVNTPRNAEQTNALNNVNSLIDGAVTKMQEDLRNSKDLVQRMLNACAPEQPEGPIDQRFQAQVIECTADDQKKIRRRLANIITQIERAQRTCVPSF